MGAQQMANTIEDLREDHRKIVKLLNTLELEIELAASAADPDWDVLRETANYFCEFVDRYHHPKEDAVYRRLAAGFSEQAASIGDLMAEHRDVHARVHLFRGNIQAMFLDAIMARDRLVNAGKKFIEAERLHMQKEEELFFPVAERVLTQDDWAEIEANLKSA